MAEFGVRYPGRFRLGTQEFQQIDDVINMGAFSLSNIKVFEHVAASLGTGQSSRAYWLLLEHVRTKPDALAARCLHFHAWAVTRYGLRQASDYTEDLMLTARDARNSSGKGLKDS